MRLRYIVSLLLCCLLCIGGNDILVSDVSANAATTSQSKSSKSSKKSKSKSGSKSKKKRGSKSRNKKSRNSKYRSSKSGRKGNSKSKNRHGSRRKKGRNAVRTRYVAPPKETAQNDSLTLSVNSALISRIPAHLNPGGLRVNSVKPNHSSHTAAVSLNENFTHLPVTRGLIDTLRRNVKEALPDSLSNYRVNLSVNGKDLSYYIRHIDKLPEQYRKNPAFVSEVNPISDVSRGMENDIVALWHSHGRYYRNGGWSWQRPILFQTLEDIYTMGYILPYVVPMLENAGAYVFLPRERDTNSNEVIVDNDTNPEGHVYSQSTYRENNGRNQWSTGEEEGFIYDLPDFRDTENPFENGSYRQTQTVSRNDKPSVAAWYADIPEDGEYAIYVSYKTLANSTGDARYTVNYSGGSKEFTVNQRMGGGTWIYLCTVPLEEGYSDTEPVVTLTNVTSGTPGSIVTADAVKIGGGMGNIARSPRRADIYYDPSTPDNNIADNEDSEEEDEEDIADENDNSGDVDGSQNTQEPSAPVHEQTKKGAAPHFSTSGIPRYLEGARYWLHWAGFPEYVYSPYHGRDDYKDDYTSRGHWVNYLAGGSRVLPNSEGLKLPVDVALALHSDAGKRSDDSFVGTLGIYYTQNGSSYRDGTPRINSRMLTDMVMGQITSDIRRQWEPRWTRRSMWDKSYVEARVPEVPTTLIELMSHQNFADMQYGLDPNFRFTVGRAIYKALARFLGERKGRQVVIQPLPVKDFQIKRLKKNHYRLIWKPVADPLEPTANPTGYAIMERTGDDMGFHKIATTKSTHYDFRVVDNEIHSFRVIATNAGGSSFASETLALREAPDHSAPVMIINGFDRVSAPGHFSADGRAGFDSEKDFGVPYIKDISFSGYQTEYRRNAGESFGRSGGNYINTVIAGNTFDYPAIHGASITNAGKGFISASASAVADGDIRLADFPVVDVILGKQKTSVTRRSNHGICFHVLDNNLKKKLRQYSDKGGRLILSGEFISSDLQDARSDTDDRKFAAEVLGLSPSDTITSNSGRIRDKNGNSISYSNTLNKDMYIVENPDALNPNPDADTETIFTFDNGSVAGMNVFRGRSKVTVMSVPFEAITDKAKRDILMKQLLSK